ncbi:MAG: DNA topoisomerase IV subunit A, partial [Kangiella sp.]|nr:DNA topoisomerase IV subunit A [Kangiella sp.]
GKGHELDPAAMSYKAGDSFKAAARGKSNQLATVLDSTGRAYSVQSHTLPSARGQGEPLSGRINPIAGATFEAVMMGASSDLYLMASDAGYGFVTTLGELEGKNKAGKTVLKLPSGAKVLTPQRVDDYEHDLIAAVSNEGRLLVFPLKDLPQMARGKGNKIIGITTSKLMTREEFVAGVAVMPVGGTLTLYAGKRHMTLRASDLEHYMGERGRRGNKLPRGYQRVDAISAAAK